MPANGLEGRTVLVTGGSRGIGFATAQAFLDAGANVAVCSRHPESLRAAEKKLHPHGRLFALVADVADPAAVNRWVQQALARFHQVDVLVNNAGVAWSGDFAVEDEASIAEVIDVNVKGVLYVTRAVLPHMLARRQGTIINLSSGAGLDGFAGLSSYCASKFAVVGFSESLDLEVRDRGVRVIAVCPGRVATDMQVQYSGKRIGIPPETVAERIVHLASEHSGAHGGRCITIS
jgi:3-oxoacyl-[acyl-carrier protein] reductase